ncbi:MAG: transcription antitermination factor NusB [Bacteroidaceae bacterium]|nr:transcription antitermination factor NusB [Bacteroidaceae bacterium]
MINRDLIRLKVVQLIYAYYQNEDRPLNVVMQELDYSLQKAHELYLFLLTTLAEIRELAEKHVEVHLQHNQRLGIRVEAPLPDQYIAENKFLQQLSDNEALIEYREKRKQEWDDEEVLVKNTLKTITDSEILAIYIENGVFDYEADRELVRKLYKAFVMNNEEYDTLLEEHGIYWNDDKEIIDSFVIKTIKRFEPENGSSQELLPAFSNEEDQDFAHKLFKEVIARGEETRGLIRDNCKNWEFNRLAFMDIIITQIAITEIMIFPNIPISVSFNEYLDIAKVYSTPKSSSYINGLLDHIVKKLKEEQIILKN